MLATIVAFVLVSLSHISLVRAQLEDNLTQIAGFAWYSGHLCKTGASANATACALLLYNHNHQANFTTGDKINTLLFMQGYNSTSNINPYTSIQHR
jgi:hypothetical protein